MEHENAQSRTNYTKLKSFVNSNQNSILTIVGVILGLASGIAMKRIVWPDQPIDPHMLRFISLPGMLYIRAFLLLITPLLILSLSTCLIPNDGEQESAQNDNKNGNLATKIDDDDQRNKQIIDEINPQRLLLITLAFFSAFTIVAALLGILSMKFIAPGERSAANQANILGKEIFETKSHQALIEKQKKIIEQNYYKSDSINNIFFDVFPSNLILPLFATSYTQTQIEWPTNLTAILDPAYVPQSTLQTIQNFKPNMIGICTISFLLGLLLRKLGPQKTQNIRHLLAEVNLLVDESFRVLIRMMPVGMFVWMFSEGLKMQSIASVATQLTQLYALVVVLFLFWWFVFWPIVLAVCARENAFRLYRQISPAILMAIGTTSSAITLPVTIRCMESNDNNNRLAKIFSRTILPLGMTVHMNGVSLYYPMVAMFVAQMKGIELDAVMLFVLLLFTFGMSVGAPAAPSGGTTLVNHIAYAALLGIDDPQDVLAFIIPFETICLPFRTATNITGDCVVAKCIEKLMTSTSASRQKPKNKIEMSQL